MVNQLVQKLARLRYGVDILEIDVRDGKPLRAWHGHKPLLDNELRGTKVHHSFCISTSFMRSPVVAMFFPSLNI